jgi:hypothetical protein
VLLWPGLALINIARKAQALRLGYREEIGFSPDLIAAIGPATIKQRLNKTHRLAGFRWEGQGVKPMPFVAHVVLCACRISSGWTAT